MTAVAGHDFGGGCMRIRLTNIMELVAGLAVGLAFARFDYTDGLVHSEPILMYYNDLLVDVLAGVAAVAGVGLGVEATRSRGRGRPWGVGRWIWALSAISLVVCGAGTAITQSISQYTEYNQIKFGHFLIVVTFRVAVGSSTSNLVAFLVAFLITRMATRWPRDVAADYREWSGRVFGVLLIVWRAVIYVYALMHPDDWRIS